MDRSTLSPFSPSSARVMRSAEYHQRAGPLPCGTCAPSFERLPECHPDRLPYSRAPLPSLHSSKTFHTLVRDTVVPAGQDRASNVGCAPRLEPRADSALQVLKNAVRDVLVVVAAETLRYVRAGSWSGSSFKGWGHVGCAHGPDARRRDRGCKGQGREKAEGGSPRLHKRLCARES